RQRVARVERRDLLKVEGVVAGERTDPGKATDVDGDGALAAALIRRRRTDRLGWHGLVLSQSHRKPVKAMRRARKRGGSLSRGCWGLRAERGCCARQRCSVRRAATVCLARSPHDARCTSCVALPLSTPHVCCAALPLSTQHRARVFAAALPLSTQPSAPRSISCYIFTIHPEEFPR